ncbi:hypothetical protein CR513_17956, partial [Mucuna pruriens]
MELSEFSLKFKLREAIKTQTLAYFLVEMTLVPRRGTMAKYEAHLAGLDLAREVQHVPHNNNSRVDTLTWLATSKTPSRHTDLHKVLASPTMNKPEVLQVEAEDRGWMTSFGTNCAMEPPWRTRRRRLGYVGRPTNTSSRPTTYTKEVSLPVSLND